MVSTWIDLGFGSPPGPCYLRPRKKIAKGESVSENLNPVTASVQGFLFLVRSATVGGIFVSDRSSRLVPARSLAGTEGELVQVRVSTDPRCLEQLLDCLASLSFPINPQLYHGVPTVVEFPAYEAGLGQVTEVLHIHWFDLSSVTVHSMMQAITAA